MAYTEYQRWLRRDMGLDDPSRFAQWYGKFTDWWKGQALASLNYPLQNILGGAAMGQMAGVSLPRHWPKLPPTWTTSQPGAASRPRARQNCPTRQACRSPPHCMRWRIVPSPRHRVPAPLPTPSAMPSPSCARRSRCGASRGSSRRGHRFSYRRGVQPDSEGIAGIETVLRERAGRKV